MTKNYGTVDLTLPSSILDPRIGRFVDNLSPLSFVFNGSLHSSSIRGLAASWIIFLCCLLSSMDPFTRPRSEDWPLRE